MLSVFALATASNADGLDPLKGKTIRVIIAAPAGQTTDIVGRAFFNHLGKVLPETTIRMQNMGESGGAIAIKELQEAQGSLVTVGIFSNGPIYSQLLGSDTAPYDLRSLKPIGSLTKVNRILVMRSGLGGASFDTLLTLGRRPIAGGSDALSPSTIELLLLNAITELRMKIVTGMSGGERRAMLLSGDIDVALGNPYQLQSQLEAGELIPVLKFTAETTVEALEGVPAIADVLSPSAPKDIVYLVDTLDKTGRIVAAAPATDPAVVEALRAAFDTVAGDNQFAAEMGEGEISIAPTSGAELAERLSRILDPSTGFSETFQSLVECGKRISDESAADCE
jgi:putative tricarboxylic transport membrane protein